MPKVAAARIAGAIVVMAVVVAIVLLVRERTGEERPPMSAGIAKGLATSPVGPLRPDAVLAIVPRGASNMPRDASFQLSPSVRQFYASRNYAPLYASLSKGHRTPEEHWVLARILEYCAMIPDEVPRGAGNPVREVVDARRARFAAALSPSDPDHDKRLAAFDNSLRNPCQDLPRLQSSRAEIDELYRQGAAAGDAKARLALVFDEMRAQARDHSARNGSPNLLKLGDDQMAVVRLALASTDPTTAMEAVTTLGFAFDNVSLRDADGKSVDIGALRNAATLIACDSGYPCGPDTREIASSCAYTSRCDTGSLRDYLYYYRSSPYDSQVLARYEAALRDAARTGNTSFLVFYPAPAPSIAAFH